MLTILPRVCADFYDKNRKLLYKITQADLGRYIELPEEVQQDPLFEMLAGDGSIKFAIDPKKDRALEQDPYAGTTPDGREIKVKSEGKAAKNAAAGKSGSAAQRTAGAQGEGPDGEKIANGQ